MPTRLVAVAVLTFLVGLPRAWAQGNLPPQAGPAPPNAVALVDRIEAAVVRIDTDEAVVGSGFVVDPKGLICTNYHVINGASRATVTFKDHRSLPVLGYVAVNRGKDLAILAVQPDAPLPSLRLSANLPAKLAVVMAFGSPKGFSSTVTQGNVSAIRDADEVNKISLESGNGDFCRRMGYDGDSTWIQNTTPISPGSSGGPLVDTQGEVVGINTWTVTTGQGLNFAVAAKHIADLLPKVAPPRPLSTLLPPLHSVAQQHPPTNFGEREREEAVRRLKAVGEAQAKKEREKYEREKALWRVWSDASGTHIAEARFSGAIGGQVKLVKKDGTKIFIPLENLSEVDREWIRDQRKQ